MELKFAFWPEKDNFTREIVHEIEVPNTRQDTLDFIFMGKQIGANKPQFADFAIFPPCENISVYSTLNRNLLKSPSL